MDCIDYFSASKEIKLEPTNLLDKNKIENVQRDVFSSHNSCLKIETENIYESNITGLNGTFHGKVKIEKDDEIHKCEDNVLNNPKFISLDLQKENNFKSELDKESYIPTKEENCNVKSENLSEDKVMLHTEIKIEEDQINNYVSDSVNNEQLKSEENENIVYKSLNCNMYDKVFSDLNIIKRHEGTNSSTISFTCKICFKMFKTEEELTKHERIHNNVIVCGICFKIFPSTFLLRAHKRRIHFRNKSYDCDMCSMKFMQPHALEVHKRLHTGERPFKCYACTEKFTRADDLGYHTLTVHTGKLKESYKCIICAETFTHLTDLQQHEIIHFKFPRELKPFQCKKCLEKFTNSQSLMDHEIKRTRCHPRPYKCDVCTKTFLKTSFLNAHRKIHIEKRPYKCSLCPRKCSSLRILRVHERSIHKRVLS